LRVYLVSYGCTANRADGNLMAELLREAGHSIVSMPEEADVFIINTCTVRTETERQMIARIRELLPLNRRVIVTGCLAGAEPGIIRKISREISMVSPQAIERIVEVVESQNPVYYLLPNVRHRLPHFVDGIRFMLPVAEGCRGSCAFCIVRIARGALRSYPPNKIIEATASAIKSGAKEVELTAQDTASYGVDIGFRLPKLLEEISRINGRFLIRVGMMNPESALEILDPLINAYRSEKVYKFLHIPVQSGDDDVLRLMRRKYTVEDFKRVVNAFREVFPEIVIATDVIVGFPGESEEAFKKTCRLLEEIRPDKVHVARFTARPHTKAMTMSQIPERVKKERSVIISKLVARIGLEINRNLVGRVIECLVVKPALYGGLEARTMSYKPVFLKDCNGLIGRFVKVKITAADSFKLFGEIAEEINPRQPAE
jgi:threonylcarbamoyladenosine tRNA methylthiotransferase CDKAL1